MFKKHYRLISFIFLLVIAAGWITFLELRKPEPAVPEKSIETVVDDAISKLESKEQLVLADTPTPEPTQAPVVTEEPTPEPTEVPTEAPTPTEAPAYTKFDYILANVNESMNVRSGAGSGNSVIGKLPANGYAKIIERGTDWFKIKSGSITGYVSTSYILIDNDAIDKMRSLNALKIQITGNEVNIRAEDNTNCDIVEKATKGKTYDYYPEYSTASFYAIKIDGKIAYVSNQYSEVFINLKTASK